MVRFLYDYGYPYLALRNAIRAGDHAAIDMMWVIAFHWFHATNKNQYAIMSVYVTFIRHALVPELQRVLTDFRTHSLAGNAMSDVGHDLALERMNRQTKSFVSGFLDLYDRLRKVAALLNAFHHVYPRFLRAIGKRERDTYERTDYKTSDKDALLDALKAKLPSTYAGLCARNAMNVFKARPAHAIPPWDVVAVAAAHGSKGATTSDTYDYDTLFVDPMGYDSDDGSDETKASWFQYVTTYMRKCPRR